LEVAAAPPLIFSPDAEPSWISCYALAYPGYFPRDRELLPDHFPLQAAKAAPMSVCSSSYPLHKNGTDWLNFDHDL
jgi:hypothetical protein